jgi:hypothetical protein
VLADILDRDGAQQSATETRARNLANADHLAVPGAIWATETKNAHDTRYRDLVMAALPPGYRQELSHQARWLYQLLARRAERAEAGREPVDRGRGGPRLCDRALHRAPVRKIGGVVGPGFRAGLVPRRPRGVIRRWLARPR